MNNISLLKKMYTINGFKWTAYVVPYVIIRKFLKNFSSSYLDQRIKHIEKKYNLPGMNSKEMNSLIWNSWNWEKKYGEEWTQSENWKQSLVDEIMLKYLNQGEIVLEIGPGGGKWTEFLQQEAKHLTLVDISEKCIEVCKNRFNNCSNLSYFVTNGSSLSFLPDNTIDFIWSFDVFVHIDPKDVDKYISEFKRVLKNKGIGIIHHAAEGGLNGGWRSNLTNQMMIGFLEKNNLKLINQFDSWGKNEQYNIKYYHDSISIFEKVDDIRMN